RPARYGPNVRPNSARARPPPPRRGVHRVVIRSRAEIGRANRARGIVTERDLARYLRVNGWPNAERKQDNGWVAGDRVSRDAGDIRNTLGLCWQAKSSPELSGEKLSTAMRQTAEQVGVAGADYGIVVHRRVGHASPARWWAYLPLGDLFALLSLQG